MKQRPIDRFLDADGKLTIWPSKHIDKQLALQYLITKFAADKTYSEAEVNEILKAWHGFADWPLLRRALVDDGYLQRDRNGYAYQRIMFSPPQL